MDVAFERALPGGAIDQSMSAKLDWKGLINPEFTIAQAGIGGNHGSVAYAADCWKLVSGTVSAAPGGGLVLNGTIRQTRETAVGFDAVASINVTSGTATATYDDATKRFDITSSGGTIKRAHLGLIAITDWSKVPKADPDKSLAKSQRHYLKISANGIYTGYTIPGYATVAFFVPLPCIMRTIPAVNILNAGTIVISGGATADLTYSGVNISENGVRISMVASIAYTAWDVAVWANPEIELLADL